VQDLRRLGVAAGVDDGDQRAPLFEGDVRSFDNLSNEWITMSNILFFFIVLVNS